jgi:transposase
MEQFIGCDAHKKYSVFVAMDECGKFGPAETVIHDRKVYREFLGRLPDHSPIAVEATGSCYWLVDEMREAGHEPQLAHPLESKRRMGKTKKTDRLDARALAMLLRNGTLPRVWIPPAELRDQREPMRMRMFLSRKRTQLKNRIHGTLTRFNVLIECSDLFGVTGREELGKRLEELPANTRACIAQELTVLDFLEMEIEQVEQRLSGLMEHSGEAQLLDTLPGVGPILSMVMALEIGDVKRFATGAHLASYAGLVPSVHSSGGHTRMGGVGRDVNHTLKWALVEAANQVAMQQRHRAGSHVVRLYQRVKRHKNHAKAVVAVGRHLAEAAYYILQKQEKYREPQRAAPQSSKQTAASSTHE